MSKVLSTNQVAAMRSIHAAAGCDAELMLDDSHELLRAQLAAAISERDEAIQRADIAEFAYKYGSPFDPTGVKRGVEIIALRKSLAAAEQERDRATEFPAQPAGEESK